MVKPEKSFHPRQVSPEHIQITFLFSLSHESCICHFYAMLFLRINPFTKADVYPGFTFSLKAVDILFRC